MNNFLNIDQALFGYKEGHNLIATSTNLSPRARQFLATVTDSSGQQGLDKNEQILTGLPISESGYYAFFCTWPAPEMPRPGCVWSHVLLIKLPDLARIADLSSLRNLFVRPQRGDELSKYSKPANFPLPKGVTRLSDEIRPRMSFLLNALYTHSDIGIVILEEDWRVWEIPVILTWSQQWPRLRREFSFSTCSFRDRRRGGQNFDLQIAPHYSERLWRNREIATDVLSFSGVDEAQEKGKELSWLEHATHDLASDSEFAFRKFLFNYGSDIECPRAGFSKLASIYEMLSANPRQSLIEILQTTGELFPNANEVVQLKSYLVSIPNEAALDSRASYAWSLAIFVLSGSRVDAFAETKCDWDCLVTLILDEKRDEICTLFGHLNGTRNNPLATAFASALARKIDSSEFFVLARQKIELVPLVISENPELAYVPDVWRTSSQIQSEIFEVLLHIDSARQDWSAVVGAMLLANVEICVRRAVIKAGPGAMDGAFKWLTSSESESNLPSDLWKESLAPEAKNFLRTNQDIPPNKLAFCAWLISPDAIHEFFDSEREDLKSLLQQPLDSFHPRLRLPTVFFVMAVALRSPSNLGSELISFSYFPLHTALASRDYPEDLWSLLQPEMPYIGLWRNWDRCEMLRRAVRNWTIQHEIPENPLEPVAITDEQKKLAKSLMQEDFDTEEFID